MYHSSEEYYGHRRLLVDFLNSDDKGTMNAIVVSEADYVSAKGADWLAPLDEWHLETEALLELGITPLVPNGQWPTFWGVAWRSGMLTSKQLSDDI